MAENELLHICCNNHENGSFAGRIFGVNVGEVYIDVRVEGAESQCKPLGGSFFRIGHIKFEYRGWTQWVGNWCWDAMTVRRETIVRLLNYLRGRRCREWQVYGVESGPEEFWEAWASDRPLTIEDIFSEEPTHVD